MALWTVKRIRHRDLKDRARYELQFTVSPMSPAATAQFVTRNGNFDYNIPGHVFVIKVKNQEQTRDRNDYGRGEKFGEKHTNVRLPYWSHNQDRFNPPSTHNLKDFTPNVFNLNTGEYFAGTNKHKQPDVDPNAGYLIGISNNYKSQETHESHESPFVSKHYYTRTPQKLQKEPIKQTHHHYYIPEVSDIDLDAKPEKQTTKNNNYVSGVKTVLPSDVHKFILTTSGVTRPILTQTTQKFIKDYAFQNYKDTNVPIPIILHPSTNFQTIPTLTSLPNNIQTIFKIIPVTIPNPTQPTPFNPSPYFIRFSEPDPTYSNNEPPTVAGYITSLNPTESTKSAFLTHAVSESSTIYRPDNNIYTTTQSTIKSERLQYPDSINAQLPPPRRGADTTIPYVSSTYVSITPNSESGQNNKLISSPTYDATTPDYHISTENEEETTEFIPTTPLTTIQKPANYSESSETTYFVETTTILPEVTTLQSYTPSRRYLNRKRPTYIDDSDIFGNRPSSTTKNIETTTEKIQSNEELLTTSSENLSTSTETSKTRLNKYLKYNRNRNYNRYNRNYNSKRLRARNVTRPEPEDVETKTSQSLITSISFQVNKNKKNYSDFSRPAILPASTDRPRSYLHKKDSEEYTTDLPETTTFTDHTRAFDEIAQTLVNHARAVTYLEQTTTPIYTTTNSH